MHPVRKQRLIVVAAIIAASTMVVSLVAYSMKEMGDFAYTISKITSGELPKGKSIRAGGCVKPGSIKKATDRLLTTFVITDGSSNLTVTYDGLLPDLFDEEEAAVVTGKLNNQGVLEATKVLAKHDESYTPKEVSDNLEQAKAPSRDCTGINYDS